MKRFHFKSRRSVASIVRLGLVLTAVGLGGCGRKSDAGAGNPNAGAGSGSHTPVPVSLRLKWLFDPGFAGEMVAERLGFFRQHGIDVSIRPGGFEADPIRLVASGADGFGVAGADAFLLARAKGVPIVAIAAGYIETPVVYYVKTSTGIRTPRDFPHHTVGVQPGQDTETIYEALLRLLRVDRTTIHEVPIKYDFTPFLTGQVDVWPGYAATQSYVLQQKGIPFAMIRPSDFGIRYLGTVYFTTADMIANHAVEVQAFVDGMIEGWDFTYRQQDSAAAVVSSYDAKALPLELVKANLVAQESFIHPKGTRYGEFSVAVLDSMQSLLVAQRLLTNKVNIDSAVALRFVAKHYAPR